MSVIYAPRAIRDLDKIAAYHRRVAGPKIAEAIGERVEAVIDRVARHPSSAPRVV
jgi:plasmid stabilization system protein ParE